MKLPTIGLGAQSDALLVGVVVVSFIGLVLFLKKQASDALIAAANVNKGTQYEGTGAVGTLGNAADQVSGGALGAIGTAIGAGLFGLFNSEYDPNAASNGVTLTTNKAAVADNYFNDSILNW